MDEYIGEGIMIEEMPQGCVITDKSDGQCVVVYSIADAQELIISLGKMIISLEKQNESN